MIYPFMNRIQKTGDIMPRSTSVEEQGNTIERENNRAQRVQSYLELCKIRIALFAALSAATGSILVTSAVTVGTFVSAAGVFFLACGAGALNQVQERKIDALMSRTKARPVPSGRITPGETLYAAIFLFISGFLVLSLSGNPVISGLGLFAVLWYNLVYTGLKKITAFAAVPGALTGTVPPAIGWITAGGSLSDMRLLALGFFFFMWQVPHFWLLLLSHAEDFRKTPAPSLHRVFGLEQLTQITAVWMSAAAVSSLFIPFYGVSLPAVINVTLLSASVWLAWNSLKLYRQKERKSIYAGAFRNINIYMAAVMLLLNIGSIFSQ
jgi:protoheme IX farnesyltransferase